MDKATKGYEIKVFHYAVLKILSSTNHYSPQLRLASTTSCASSILKETLNGSFLIHGAKFE
jgi:hypothetical protein